MNFHSEIELFLALNERVRSGVATPGERERWAELKQRLIQQQSQPGQRSASGKR